MKVGDHPQMVEKEKGKEEEKEKMERNVTRFPALAPGSNPVINYYV